MIVKIWPIKASHSGRKSKGSPMDGLKNAEDYIKDEEKVIAAPETYLEFQVFDEGDMLENSFINTEADFHKVVDYMANEDKTKAKYVSTYLCEADNVTQEFQRTAELLAVKSKGAAKTETGAVAFHLVQSFPENLDITDQEVHECGLELVKRLEKYQALVCSHVHPVVNEKGEVHGA